MGRRPVEVVEKFSWVPFVGVLAGVVVQQVRAYHGQLGRWDFLQISGWVALAGGLAMAATVPRRLDRTLHRLRDRGSLDASEQAVERLEAMLARRAPIWGVIGAGLAAAGVLVTFAAAGRGDLTDELQWIEALGALVGGYELGRTASYASLGSLLKKASCGLKVTPGHFDGAGGLKPIGDYYFFHAVVAGIPAAFLAVWWIIIPLVPRDYRSWRNPYLGLLMLALAVELLCFFLPIWYFHGEMDRQKNEYLREADRLSSEMASLEASVARADDVEASKAVTARVAEARQRYLVLESMPTWPVDPATGRRFRVSNLALLIPLAAKVVGKSGPWKEIADALSRLGS